MSNILKMPLQIAVQQLFDQGHSRRQIAELLQINRRTVNRYIAKDRSEADSSAPATPQELVAHPEDSKCTTAGLEVTTGSGGGQEAKCTTPDPKVTTGSRSLCAAFEDIIGPMVEQGLTAQRVYQDLVASHGFAGSYPSVRRFVARLRNIPPSRVWRVECAPGEEMQVDFGLGALVVEASGKRRHTWVFRAVLSHSRKGYAEAVYRQDTETFLRVLENAIRHFGGAPLLLNLDNLKAAVKKADWFDPEINPKLLDFGRHYSITPMPCRAYTPQHKGKVERGVAYVKQNALKGLSFPSLAAENAHLLHWETHVADKRIHGTTKRQVAAMFEAERASLQPLPVDLFASFQEGRRKVHRDGFVEVEKAWYEAPPEYLGREVWVRWDGRMVRLLNDHMQQIAAHPRVQPGTHTRTKRVRGLSAPVPQCIGYWKNRAEALGASVGKWAARSLAERGAEGIRAVQGCCNLAGKYRAAQVDEACGKAMGADSRLPTLRSITDLLKSGGAIPEQRQMDFREEDPVIRSLEVYAGHVRELGGIEPFPEEPMQKTP